MAGCDETLNDVEMYFDRKFLMMSLDCLWVVVVPVSDRQLRMTHLETPSVLLVDTWWWPQWTKIFLTPILVRQIVTITDGHGKDDQCLSSKHVAGDPVVQKGEQCCKG